MYRMYTDNSKATTVQPLKVTPVTYTSDPYKPPKKPNAKTYQNPLIKLKRAALKRYPGAIQPTKLPEKPPKSKYKPFTYKTKGLINILDTEYTRSVAQNGFSKKVNCLSKINKLTDSEEPVALSELNLAEVNPEALKLLNLKVKNMRVLLVRMNEYYDSIKNALNKAITQYNTERTSNAPDTTALQTHLNDIQELVKQTWSVNIHIDCIEAGIKTTTHTQEQAAALIAKITQLQIGFNKNNNNGNNTVHNNSITLLQLPKFDIKYNKLYNPTKKPTHTELVQVINILKLITKYYNTCIKVNNVSDNQIYPNINNQLNELHEYKILCEKEKTIFNNTPEIYDYIVDKWLKHVHVLYDHQYKLFKEYKYIKREKGEDLRFNLQKIVDIVNKLNVYRKYKGSGIEMQNILQKVAIPEMKLEPLFAGFKSMVQLPSPLQQQKITYKEIIEILSENLGYNITGKPWYDVISKEVMKQAHKADTQIKGITLKKYIECYINTLYTSKY